jgi:hypothetical protein
MLQAGLIGQLQETRLQVQELREAVGVKGELEAMLKSVQAENEALKRQAGSVQVTGQARNMPQQMQSQPQGAVPPPAPAVAKLPPSSMNKEQLMAVLVNAAAPQAKQILGERLYALIHPEQGLLAGKITRMLLAGLTNTELVALIDDHTALLAKIQEALAVLEAHQQKVGSVQVTGQARNMPQQMQSQPQGAVPPPAPAVAKLPPSSMNQEQLMAVLVNAAAPQAKQILGECGTSRFVGMVNCASSPNPQAKRSREQLEESTSNSSSRPKAEQQCRPKKERKPLTAYVGKAPGDRALCKRTNVQYVQIALSQISHGKVVIFENGYVKIPNDHPVEFVRAFCNMKVAEAFAPKNKAAVLHSCVMLLMAVLQKLPGPFPDGDKERASADICRWTAEWCNMKGKETLDGMDDEKQLELHFKNFSQYMGGAGILAYPSRNVYRLSLNPMRCKACKYNEVAGNFQSRNCGGSD